MKKSFALIALFLLTGCSASFADSIYPSGFKPYGEVAVGVLASNGSQSPAYTLHGGFQSPSWQLSLGYMGAYGLRNDNLISDGLALHTLSLEAYRLIPYKAVTFKAGGGVGYTIPNLNGGASETADNSDSWLVGGGAEYSINDAYSVGLDLKGFFFSTDTHITVYSSHFETLSTGQSVEVLDVTHHNDRINMNSVLATVSLRFK